MTVPDPSEELPIDLESISQIELDRAFGCDSDSVILESGDVSPIQERHHRRCDSSHRELLNNRFLDVE